MTQLYSQCQWHVNGPPADMPLIKFVTSTEQRRARIAPCYEEARAQLCTASRQSVLRQLAEYEQKLKEVHITLGSIA